MLMKSILRIAFCYCVNENAATLIVITSWNGAQKHAFWFSPHGTEALERGLDSSIQKDPIQWSISRTLSIVVIFYLKWHFGEWALSASSRTKPTLLVPIDRASLYFRKQIHFDVWRSLCEVLLIYQMKIWNMEYFSWSILHEVMF
jgi:hypothetical protein